ncbi:hypothetical protein LZ639_12435 [Pseudomonas stutzeri]|mgnify:CR=1 FL=1|jgi:hypothetical protein|uniref:Uncharacterized protein n=1 Tax=Stutzerimonas stutzeri TaxID=316 RepID=A0A4S2B7V4_STUST|nr:hypothetical protein [Stutzerimonas stutzeri]EPL62191.1 hypothetical protein B382_13354 [Stutzerimonas stutzeri B1SMN1]MBA4689795.1 hypothetical protein [Pseudomonas sp.]NMY66764.1 hypothetical protein [Pseudomonas sp. WS 5018]AVX12582.2 hypothetical protein CXB48_07175 [Stutzerimonas stutzeri]MBH3353507.1 hypothetical protein [Stutzerimonas stutzeri]
MKTPPPAKVPSKTMSILAYFLAGATLNRFEAEPLGDHCLNSTISELANRRGVTLNRTPEKVPNRWGKRCRVPRYSVPATEREHANAILATLERNALSNRED